MRTENLPKFGAIKFNGKLRPSQIAAASIIEPELDQQGKHLHIVAPPGSGKTVLGLYVWSDLVRKPTLVLSPNSAIQAQWAARTDLFDLDGKDEFISTDPENPGLLTSLTYQSITMPKRGGDSLDDSAIELWIKSLIAKKEAIDDESALAWIDDLRTKAQKKIPKFAFEYLDGGCNEDVNLHRNTSELREVQLKPNYLRNHGFFFKNLGL